MGARSLPMHRVRGLLRLVGEVRELGCATEAARRHLASGLVREIGAVVGGVVLDHGYRPNVPCGVKMATLAGFDDGTLPTFACHNTHGSSFNPVHLAIMGRPANVNDVVTQRNDDLIEKRQWERAPWVTDYARPAQLAHFLTSVRWVGDARAEGMGFMRGRGERPFSDEERDIINLVHSAAGRLFDHDAPTLAPRVRQTLDALLTGASDKDVAQRLGISLHTARQYVKTVLQTYRVGSRGELIVKHLRSTLPSAAQP